MKNKLFFGKNLKLGRRIPFLQTNPGYVSRFEFGELVSGLEFKGTTHRFPCLFVVLFCFVLFCFVLFVLFVYLLLLFCFFSGVAKKRLIKLL